MRVIQLFIVRGFLLIVFPIGYLLMLLIGLVFSIFSEGTIMEYHRILITVMRDMWHESNDF
jgi:hypothetical protein